MKTPEHIKDSITKTFNSIDAIEEVKVSPFFKEKTLQRLFADKEEKQVFIASWFTPKWQLAMLVVIIALNVFAINKMNKSTYENEVNYLAETFDLTSTSEDSIFY